MIAESKRLTAALVRMRETRESLAVIADAVDSIAIDGLPIARSLSEWRTCLAQVEQRVARCATAGVKPDAGATEALATALEELDGTARRVRVKLVETMATLVNDVGTALTGLADAVRCAAVPEPVPRAEPEPAHREPIATAPLVSLDVCAARPGLLH